MSDFYNKYPYTDFHELNLDYILEHMKKLRKEFDEFVNINTVTFADPILWSITREYGKNEVVLDNSGNAYLSLQIIPAGIALDNTDYWMEIFNFTGFISAIDSNITFNIENNTDVATANYSVDDWILIDNILYRVIAAINEGDTFEEYTNINRFTLEQFIKSWVASCTQIINQYKNDIDASELAFTTALQAAFDAAVGAVTVDSEVVLARKGWNGYAYATLADSVQGQVSELGKKFEYDPGAWTANSAIIATNGSGTSASGYSRTGHVTLDPDTKELTIYAANGNATYGIAFYNNWVYVSGAAFTVSSPFSISKNVIAVPAAATSFRMSTVSSFTTDTHIIDTTSLLNVSAKTYMMKTVINKPMVFNSDNIIVFGDSIMKGYLPDSTLATAPWIDQFAAKVGASNLRNEAQGGSGYYHGANNIYNQLQGIDFNQRTKIIIASGTNDYYYNVALSDMQTAVENAFTYLDAQNTNNADVIIITPVPRIPAQQYNGDPLDAYREIITQAALEHKYTVIDGSTAPFNTTLDTYMNDVMSDGLHPTQLGYDIYANWIESILL